MILIFLIVVSIEIILSYLIIIIELALLIIIFLLVEDVNNAYDNNTSKSSISKYSLYFK